MKPPPFKSDDELLAYIEEQERLLGQINKFRKRPAPHEGLATAPAPIHEMEHFATEGNAMAQFNLSVAYTNGNGVERDLEKARGWLLKSAEAGFPPAQYNVACHWLEQNDNEKAFEWFMKAAQQNFGPAQYHVGALYAFCGDFVGAYIWSYLAEQNQVEQARNNTENAAARLSKDELNQARFAVSALMFNFRNGL